MTPTARRQALKGSLLFLSVATLALYSTPFLAHAQVTGQAPELDQVKVVEHLGDPLPKDVRLRDHTGRTRKLSEFFQGDQPVVLNFAYHSCPVLCDMVLNATLTGLNQIPWVAGRQYRFVSISIDPRDTPQSAAQTRDTMMGRYSKELIPEGWTFLTGEVDQIKPVADATGFEYYFHEGQQEYAHPAAIFLVTPKGRMARYLYGLKYTPNDIRLGLLEAAKEGTISTLERVLIYCYRYDPQGGKYVLVATRVMQVGGALTAVIIAAFLVIFWRRELKRPKPDTEQAIT